jgi:hypothetical protein
MIGPPIRPKRIWLGYGVTKKWNFLSSVLKLHAGSAP